MEDIQKEDAELAQGLELLQNVPDDDPELGKTKVALSKAIEQKRKWREDATAKAAEIEKLAKELEQFKKPPEPPKPETPPKEEFVRKEDLAAFQQEINLARTGFSDEELQLARDLAKARGKSIVEVAQDESNKPLFEALRAKSKAEQATLPPSKSSPTFNEKPLSELKPEEIRANWDEIKRKAIEAGKKNRQEGLM